jgi:hypothetical protein
MHPGDATIILTSLLTGNAHNQRALTSRREQLVKLFVARNSSMSEEHIAFLRSLRILSHNRSYVLNLKIEEFI